MSSRLDDGSVAVIGAGLAGLTAARALAAAGRDVTLFEKSRGRGGRMATRRADGRHFDHGAQYFTVRSPAFRAEVARWSAAGAAARWRGRVVELPGGEEIVGERFVGVPGMSAVGGFLAAELSIRLESRVTAMWREEDRWLLETADGTVERSFATVLLATPAEQAVPLLGAAPALAARAAGAQARPCWAVLLGLAEALDVPFDGARFRSGALSWAARDSSKPGRPRAGGAEEWVLHAAPEWSEARLDVRPSDVVAELVRAFAEAVGVPPSFRTLAAPAFAAAHLWRYALTALPGSAPCLWDARLRIGACGDWCLGARVEAAFVSGRALAARVLE